MIDAVLTKEKLGKKKSQSVTEFHINTKKFDTISGISSLQGNTETKKT